MKRIALLALAALSLSAILSFGAAAQPYENASVVGQVPDRVVLLLKPGVAMTGDKAAGSSRVEVPALEALAERFQVKGMEQLYGGMTAKLADKSIRDEAERYVAVDFPAEMGLHRVQAAFAARPEVEKVMLVDICRNYAYLPNDPGLSGSQWYVRNLNLSGGDTRAVGAWNETLGDSNVVVAVVDSGVDWNHPDLGGPHPDRVNGAIRTNWAEYYGNPGVDDDSNGKIDDIRGWDFVNVPGQGYPDEDDATPDNDPMDYESHGTAIAGMVAGIGNNGIGVAGVAHGCKILPVRVGWLPDGESLGVVRMDFASQGMIYASGNGADAINCSWGSTSFLSFAVSTATSAGVAIFTAAGNDNTDSDPGNGVPSYLSTHPDVIAVAATNSSDGKASFSNYGTWVEVSAPGAGIYTTWYSYVTQTRGYSTVDGTSFASPIAAACYALIKSGTGGNRTTCLGLLLNNCDDIDALNPAYAGLLGNGRVNLLKALGDNVHLYPDEFPTLYDALHSGAAGDTIKVANTAPLVGPVTIDERGLVIYGGYDASFTTRDPAGSPTVIDGSLSSTVMRFSSGTGSDTVVDGFKLVGGGGQDYSGIPYTARYGGGLIVKDASPVLRNLEITGCSVGLSSQLGCGGGIMLVNSDSYLENVWIHGNTGIYGAGVFVYDSNPTLIDCTIEDNVSRNDNLSYAPLGGGIHVLDSNLYLSGCVIDGHADLNNGGGVYAAGVGASTSLTMTGGSVSGNSALNNGGGIYLSGGQADLFGVTISDNTKLPASSLMNGGGIYANGTLFSADSLTCTGNQATFGGGLYLTSCSSASLSRSLVAGNTGSFLAGGLSYQNNAAGSLSANTFAGNAGTSFGAGGIQVTGTAPDMSNNLVAFNTGGTNYANGVAVVSVPPSFLCNDVFGNAGADYSGMTDPTGTGGNISADPLFCDAGGGDYRIGAGSPCAPANSGGCDLIGALGVCAASPVPGDGETPLAFRLDKNFPNPFNPRTTIRFALPEAGRTRVVVFDVAGRQVKTLVDEDLSAQVHSVIWNGDDDRGRTVAAGVYFYMVTSGDDTSVGRMALVK